MSPKTPKATSLARRRIYFYVFTVLFLVLIPVAVLFANGYRFNAQWRLVATGGIALSDVPNDADVYINYQPKKSSSFFGNTYYIKDLVPGDYFVVVAKAGDWSWAKHITVFAKQVGEADPFLLPQKATLVPITSTVTPSDSSDSSGIFAFFSATTSAPTANPEYQEVAALFATSTFITPTDPLVSGQQEFWYQSDEVFEQKFDNPSSSSVPVPMPIYSAAYQITQLAFYPNRNDVLLVLTTNGLYAVETDQRTPQNIEPVYLAPNIDFRVGDDGQIYIEKGGDFYQVQL